MAWLSGSNVLHRPQPINLDQILGAGIWMPGTPRVTPASWTSGRPGGPPRFLCIHYTAGSEGPNSAEDGVAYDQRRTDGTSAHFYVDRNSIIQCVDTANRSHTAKYYGNLWGIHIEQCGTVQTRAQWLDAASRETIRNTARVSAWAMKTHNIPLARLVGRQVRTGRGITGHVDCTTGFPEDNGSHTDPGTAYPYDVLFADIKALLAPEDDMPLTDADVKKIWEYKVQGDWLSGGNAVGQVYRYLTKDGEVRKEVAGVASNVWRQQVTSPELDNGAPHSAHEGVINAIQLVRDIKDLKADVAQLADTVTQPVDLERLADLLAARMATPPTAAEIAEAVADEDHRRSEA